MAFTGVVVKVLPTGCLLLVLAQCDENILVVPFIFLLFFIAFVPQVCVRLPACLSTCLPLTEASYKCHELLSPRACEDILR